MNTRKMLLATAAGAARPGTAHLPARWWRMVVARACQQVPGVQVVTGGGE